MAVKTNTHARATQLISSLEEQRANNTEVGYQELLDAVLLCLRYIGRLERLRAESEETHAS